MNLFNVIENIEKIDPELGDRINPRRSAIRNMASFGSKVAVAALPFAFGTLLKKAYGQSLPTAIVDVLNYALTLEYLEAEFYNQGRAASGLIPASDKSNYFDKISRDENNHVAFLQKVLGSSATPKSAFTFDLTANGAFADVLSNYDTFLKVSVAFEDTGVRAYKGQVGAAKANADILTAAVSIHAVEARHAAIVRYVLNKKLNLGLKPWIVSTTTGNDTGIAAVNGNYEGEDNVSQAGVDITKLPATGTSASKASATAAFDEPLTKDAVLDLLVGSFIKLND
ncbi:ferritin-like domain-containing protein [Mucilaginibacter sp. UR6-1]|uniref:ferritin-like domain-containing protein n=1 Tax=Mucilaginibacter sp. UR6-1 TaxID=1435643 RepID=UPI001E490DF9|nr:ferritin-like domain-containing protein [Mucilaginibacter sp. UR6-1]MCC8407535.1 ferritin-like domain-containing protein [Mucilaginibacter sp. UR6-1]